MQMLSRTQLIVGVSVLIVVAGYGWWYWQDRAAPVQELQTYSNTKYGLSFKYPAALPKLTEYPDGGSECKNQDGFAGKGLNSVVVAESNDYQFYVSVTCEPLTKTKTVYPEEIDQHDAATTLVKGTTIYSHEWTSATGYQWSVLQFALDRNHYAEIAYTLKNSAESLPEYVILHSGDWDNITSSITVPNKPSSMLFSEQNLLGNWIDVTDGQEIDFRTESGRNIFNSFVDKRPEYVDCVWKLEDNTVSIDCPTIKDSFNIVSLTPNENLIIDREGVQFTFTPVQGI